MMSTQDETPRTANDGDHDRVSDRVASVYASARERAGETLQNATASLEANPLAALVGGLAVGAALGALLPRSARERDLLAPVGSRIGEAARAALGAARDTGKQSFVDNGLSSDQLREQVNKLVEQALAAAGQAGTAALAAARETAKR
jgi:ElaB/YqjD/DUF883 family membrane-anchored ribosome-binding protein